MSEIKLQGSVKIELSAYDYLRDKEMELSRLRDKISRFKVISTNALLKGINGVGEREIIKDFVTDSTSSPGMSQVSQRLNEKLAKFIIDEIEKL